MILDIYYTYIYAMKIKKCLIIVYNLYNMKPSLASRNGHMAHPLTLPAPGGIWISFEGKFESNMQGWPN